MPTLDQTQGCLLGLALGDACGAPFEGGVVERLLWRWIGRTRDGKRRWTDDTQMSIDVVESLLATGTIDPDDLAQRFARGYRWSRGYGPGARKILRRIARGMDWRKANRSVYPEGSFGNGAAMRAPIIGLMYAERPAELADAATQSAIVTHAHHLAIEGAMIIARATAAALRLLPSDQILAAARSATAEFAARFAIAQAWLAENRDISPKQVTQQLGNGIAAHKSCVTALYLALRFREQPFETMLRFIASCGGDADTIGAMAGGIWGAANGASALPAQLLQELEDRERLTALATALHAKIVE